MIHHSKFKNFAILGLLRTISNGSSWNFPGTSHFKFWKENTRDNRLQGRWRINLRPKTIKQRIENDQIYRLFHNGYQDDIFDTISPIKKKQCLLADNSVLSHSDNSDSSPSSHSSLGPILSWPVLPSSSTPKKTRLSLQLHPDPSTYQHHAYIHKRLKEKNIVKRIPKQKKLLYNSEEKSRFDSLVNVVRDSELCREEVDEVTHCESYFEFDSEM